jgi:hypothetical protein
MDFLEECEKRQAELLLILRSVDHEGLWAGDELSADSVKDSARAAISQYEKIIHMLKGDQIGHA